MAVRSGKLHHWCRSTGDTEREDSDNSLVIGNPGKVKRAVTEEEIRWNLKTRTFT